MPHPFLSPPTWLIGWTRVLDEFVVRRHSLDPSLAYNGLPSSLYFSSSSLLSNLASTTMTEGERPTFDIAVPAKDPEPKEDDKPKHTGDKGKARDESKDEGPEMVRLDVRTRVKDTQIAD